ncbi:MAG: corrinoid protein [Bacteroidales bacterium]|nr:corrinoid protein [Bacteroidales bacterium]MCF8338066.1 corrinoid protein [Bacteroidales bacterium]
MSYDLGKITETLIQGKVDQLTELTQSAIDSNAEPAKILNEGLLPGMDTVGEKWKNGEMFMPEVLRCAKAMSKSMDILRPKLSEGELGSAGTLVIGTVAGDLHDIGKDLVGMMFEGAGYKVINIGIDQPNENFVNAAIEHKPDVLGMSALLTTTMPRMGEVINSLKEAGIRDQVTVMVGGAPVTEEYAQEIGADLYGANASTAVDVSRDYFEKAKN